MLVFVLHLIIAQTRFKWDIIFSFSDSEPSCDSDITDDAFVGPNTCQPVLSQDNMHFSCAIKYNGTKELRLQWEDVKSNQTLKECNGSQPNRTSCNLTLQAEPQHDGSHFRCNVLTSHGEQYKCDTKPSKAHCKIY